MPGMSFGQPTPESYPRSQELGNREEIFETLIDLGFINNEQGLLPEDVTAIEGRMNVITQKYGAMSSEALTALAYVDRIISANPQSEESTLAKVDGGIVSPLIKDNTLASSQDFLLTVVALAKKNYTEGVAPFSEALLRALKTREEQIKSVPEVDGLIDGQDNVMINNPGTATY
jgi:hypothetical protein